MHLPGLSFTLLGGLCLLSPVLAQAGEAQALSDTCRRIHRELGDPHWKESCTFAHEYEGAKTPELLKNCLEINRDVGVENWSTTCDQPAELNAAREPETLKACFEIHSAVGDTAWRKSCTVQEQLEGAKKPEAFAACLKVLKKIGLSNWRLSCVHENQLIAAEHPAVFEGCVFNSKSSLDRAAIDCNPGAAPKVWTCAVELVRRCWSGIEAYRACESSLNSGHPFRGSSRLIRLFNWLTGEYTPPYCAPGSSPP